MEKNWHNLLEYPIEPRPVLEDMTVVIPTLGREILQECLYWIASGKAWPGELLVIDQGSSARVAAWMEILCGQGINGVYIPSSECGRSAGINRGLERVKTRFVAVTDDDCFVDPAWSQTITAYLRNSPDVIITGKVEPAFDSDVDFCVVTSQEHKVYRKPQLKVHPLIGGNMGAAMDQVQRIGLFDEHPCMRSAEDSDWGYRALRLGIPIIYTPEIVVRHYGWRNEHQRAARYRDYARSQGGFYGKYLLSGDLLIPLQACRDLMRGPVRWLRGTFKRDQDMIDRGRADTVALFPGILAGLLRKCENNG